MTNIFLKKFFNFASHKNAIFSFNTLNFSSKIRKPAQKPVLSSDLKATQQSLTAKGYLRTYKPYDPPENVGTSIESISNEIIGCQSFNPSYAINNLEKFNILNRCYKEFNHFVPNSLLYKIKNLGDIVQFYKTPVSIKTPLEAMKDIELPPNLHIQYEAHRFHPETDTMFNGVSAFPRSSTIVTGLKYKKKYKGYTTKSPWN